VCAFVSVTHLSEHLLAVVIHSEHDFARFNAITNTLLHIKMFDICFSNLVHICLNLKGLELVL